MRVPLLLGDRVGSLCHDLVTEYSAQHPLPGIVVTVFDDDRHWTTAAGSLGAAEQRPVGDESIFRIASMTKSFTAAAVLALRDDGALSLDAPIADLAPSLSGIVGSTTDAPPITLRLLLTMSAGFAGDDPWADRLLDADVETMDDLFRRGAHHAHPTGTAFQYSNYGFAMIGRAVEESTGTPLRHHVTSRLLVPLKMTDTVWDPPTGDRVAIGQRWVSDPAGTDHGQWAAEWPPLADGGVAPMGGLWSTAEDLRRWVLFMLDAFPARNDPDDGPLRRSSRREQQQLHRSHGPSAAFGGSTGYGMGLQVLHDPLLGHVVTHSGGLPGYGSNMRWLVDHGIGIVALANLTYAPMAALTSTLAQRLADDSDVAANPAVRPLPGRRRSAPDAPHVTAAHAFLCDVLSPVLGGGEPDWQLDSEISGWAINVEPDETFDRRTSGLCALLASVGPIPEGALSFSDVVIEHGAAGHFFIAVGGGEARPAARVDFTLNAEQPPRVQHLDFTLVQ